MNLFLKLVKSVFNIQKFNSTNSRYHRDAKKILENYTTHYDLTKDPKIPHNALLKMQWYMAEFIYSAEMLNDVKGTKSSPEEREIYLLSGAVVAICDLIIDDLELNQEEILELKEPKLENNYQRDIFKLYAELYHHFFTSLGEKKSEVLKYYHLLYDAQIRSKRQFDSNIAKKEVDEICLEKGGYSLLYIRAMLEGKIDALEKETWHEIGGYIQFCNDAQDLHKDLKNNLRTFGTCRNNLHEIAADLDRQKIKAFTLLKAYPFQETRKDFLLFTLHSMGIGILAKLRRYLLLCDQQFSLDKLAAKSKAEVRPQLKAIKLVPYWFPRMIKYRYEKVDQAFNFKFQLKN